MRVPPCDAVATFASKNTATDELNRVTWPHAEDDPYVPRVLCGRGDGSNWLIWPFSMCVRER